MVIVMVMVMSLTKAMEVIPTELMPTEQMPMVLILTVVVLVLITAEEINKSQEVMEL